jgi:hypothetical protein
MYANYYLHGFVPDDLVMLGNDLSLESMANSLGSFFRGLGTDLLTAGKDVLDSAKRILAEFQYTTSNLTNAENLQEADYSKEDENTREAAISGFMNKLDTQQKENATEKNNKK